MTGKDMSMQQLNSRVQKELHDMAKNRYKPSYVFCMHQELLKYPTQDL